MSAGDYAIFIDRPIAASMPALGAAILLYAAWSGLTRRARWRNAVGLEE